MNANELADELENTYPFVGVMEIAATMLRQQQAEIDALKKQLYFKDYYEELPDTPVDLLKLAVRELTNEEIGDFTHRMVLCCGVHPNSADINVLGLKFIVEEILRKAQEK
jgi:hypothetical protein